MKKIKWKNIVAIILCIASGLLLIHDIVIVCTSTAGFTYFGIVTFLIAMYICYNGADYLLEEYKKVSAYEENRHNQKKQL